jgi:hypothetical protein
VKDPRPEIHIPNIRFPVFLAMMYFLYTDSVDVSLEYTLELMGASTQFALDLLKVSGMFIIILFALFFSPPPSFPSSHSFLLSSTSFTYCTIVTV